MSREVCRAKVVQSPKAASPLAVPVGSPEIRAGDGGARPLVNAAVAARFLAVEDSAPQLKIPRSLSDDHAVSCRAE